jgi:hypothetical protein
MKGVAYASGCTPSVPETRGVGLGDHGKKKKKKKEKQEGTPRWPDLSPELSPD